MVNGLTYGKLFGLSMHAIYGQSMVTVWFVVVNLWII